MGSAVKHHSAAQDALLSEHFISGRRVGLLGLPSSLAEGQPGTPEYEQWIQGWRSGNRDRAYEDAMWSTA